MKTTFQINKDAYDLIANNYVEEHQGFEWEAELQQFKSLLPQGNLHLLDLGCGPAHETVWLAENIPSSLITGIDASAAMLNVPNGVPQNVELIETDMCSYVPSEKIQGIWARASMHHLNKDDLFTLFEHIHTYLDTEGIIGMVNKYGKEEKVEQQEKYGHLLERYFHYFDERLVRQISQRNHLKIIEQYVKQNDHTWLVTFLKKE